MKLNFLIISTLLWSLCAQAEIVERIVATINNEVITSSDVKIFANKLGRTAFLDDLLLQGKTQAELAKDPEAQLNYLINEKVLSSEIKRLNLSVTMDKVDSEIRDIAKRNNMTTEQLFAAVKQQGADVAEYQNFMKTKAERQALIESEITSKIRVSDEDVMGHYMRTHPEAASGVFEYTISHIFFNPKKGGPEAAVERANGVLSKLRAGEAFEVLAEQHSEDPNFTNGGLLGTFKAGEISGEMSQAVAPLSPGEYTGVVKTKNGIHILKLVSKKIVADPQFEKQKETIRNQLFEVQFQKTFKNWLAAKREDDIIKINK